jgi:hypothetical protein
LRNLFKRPHCECHRVYRKFLFSQFCFVHSIGYNRIRSYSNNLQRGITLFDPYGRRPRRSLRKWIAELAPGNQLGLGCLGILISAMVSLYCAGTFSVLVRPILFQYAPTPIISQVTLPPQPTATLTLIFVVPTGGPVPRTPTQGRIPTRETATPSATFDPSSSPTITISSTLGTPRVTVTGTRATVTPTRR